jgi:PAS domain S-box-containing protein
MVLSFVVLAFVTAVAAGLPAICLIRAQLERQAWAQVEQGSRAAQALYAARQSEVASLTTLAAQRPTLRRLMLRQDRAELAEYLRPLQSRAGLDAIWVCTTDNRLLAHAGESISNGALCSTEGPPALHTLPAGDATHVWLLTAEPVISESGVAQGKVVAGMRLDGGFVAHMRSETGLEHSLLVSGQVAASSVAERFHSVVYREPMAVDRAPRGSLELAGSPYYITWFSLPTLFDRAGVPDSSPASRLEAEVEVALPVADIVATQRNLIWTLTGTLLGVAALGSVLGTLLARRIGQPLAQLAGAATTLSTGNLESSLVVETNVREVALAVQALERARIDLHRSLTELKLEKAWADHLLEAIVEGIVTLDQRGQITFFSQGAERITGWKRDEVLHRICDDVFRPADSTESFSQFIPPPGQRRKITLELANGRVATLAVTGARLAPPATRDARVALVFRDVSEEEVVHRIMGHFLANIAHEFRTPLSALAASAELLLDQAGDLTTTELEDLLGSLHLGILGLQTLVDNLLESASIEAGRFRVSPHPTNLGQIIAEAVRTMQPLLDRHGQRLMVELPVSIPIVRADSRRMVQVLVNLLSNASKYGPDDAEICIGATVAGEWVRVAISDRGPGVPPEHRNDVFRRFMYPDKNNHKVQYGVGLGLSVVKAVVQAHNGQVGVDDRAGGGATFWFTLPVEGEG